MRYTNVVTESRMPCHYCGALFHHMGHGSHQTRCAKRTNEERETWLEKHAIYMPAGKSRTVETRVTATPLSTYSGDRTGVYITVDTRALNALFATARVERIGDGPGRAEPEEEPPLVEHHHHHEQRRPALPPPPERKPRSKSEVSAQTVLLVLREGEGRVSDIVERLAAKGYQLSAQATRNHLYRLADAKLAQQRIVGLWSATEAAYGLAIEPKQPGLSRNPKFAPGYVTIPTRLLAHLPTGKPFRVSEMYRELAKRHDVPSGDLPKTADSFNTILCSLNTQGVLRRVDKGVYIKLDSANGGIAAVQ